MKMGRSKYCKVFTVFLIVGTALVPIGLYSQEKVTSLEAEVASLQGGSLRVEDKEASGSFLVKLEGPAPAIKFSNVPAATNLSVRYASLAVGKISIAVNNQAPVKLNVHSSGALTGSYLFATIEVNIARGSSITISREMGDVSVNIDKIELSRGHFERAPDIWNLPALPVANGPYDADWKGISRRYVVPEWWRDAKFGAWSHWDPQSMPERGDWYARKMYMENDPVYRFHVSKFGPLSEYGYKDICHNWVIDRWNPEDMMNLVVEMGARYFMAMGVHHDNFDCWNSTYQPWNSVNVGPKVDIVGTWEKIARKHGLHFGIGFHNTPPRTWGQFMPVRYKYDSSRQPPVAFDALQTIKDGKGKWWEGFDPVDLYGPIHARNDDPLRSPFANQFMWRVDDALNKYHPDVIYFDEHAGDSQVDLGVHMGLGFLAPQLIANYYNKSLDWNGNKMNVVINLKGVGGRWNSFQRSGELLPFVDRSLVKSSEAHIEPEIMAYSFQTETSIADWHYMTGMKYLDAKKIIELLVENVCRNGTMLLNLTQHGRGDLDPEVIQTCKDVGAWLKINGEAIYGSRPFEVYGEDSIRFTRNKGYVYAIVMNWRNNPVTLKSLSVQSHTLGKVTRVEMLGSNLPLKFEQSEKGLSIQPANDTLPLKGVLNPLLARDVRVFRITHDKGWFNDDDPRVKAAGWFRQCNLGTGDFNNDLTISETMGDSWTSTFTGTGLSIVAPRENGSGKFEVKIDGQSKGVVDLSTSGSRLPQQIVYTVKGLRSGQHSIGIINRSNAKVAIDALVVR